MSDSTQTDSKHQSLQADWQASVIEKLAMSALEEQKKARRWSTFFKLLTFLYLGLIVYQLYVPGFGTEIGSAGDSHTAVIDVVGMISEDSESNADRIIKGLRKPLMTRQPKGLFCA